MNPSTVVRHRSASVALLAVLSAATLRLPHPAAAAAQEPGRVLDEILAPGTTLEIDNIRGPIVVRAATGARATVDARIVPAGSSAVRANVERSAGRVRVCTVYGTSSSASPCSSHDDVDGDRASVSYDVAVPPGVNVTVRDVSGAETLRGVRGNVDAQSVDGDVIVAAGGNVRVSTVKGDVDADVRGSAGAVDVHTVNGRIALHLARSADATVRARTLSGAITGEPPLDLTDHSGSFVGHSAVARIGGGRARISLETVNGSIHADVR